MAQQLIAARKPDGIAFYSKEDSSKPIRSIPGSQYVTSPDGKLLVASHAEGVDVYRGAGEAKLLSIPEPGVVLMALSPACGYLVTCCKGVKDEAGNPGKNLKVWDLTSGSLVQSMAQKQVSKDYWPAVHFGAGDACLAHAVTNAVHVYAKSDNFATYKKITIKGVATIALSLAPADSKYANCMAAFIPEAKGSPAAAGVFSYAAAGEPQALVRKSFFRTQGARFMWNSSGSSCLVLGHTDVDVTNQSYYGEQKLHYLPADAAKADAACTVPLPKDGPVHDVQWAPSGDYFVVVAGFIPAKVMVYDSACKPVYDLGSGPFNLARWSPFGRFLAVAGFGNLPGDIIFYDRKAKSGALKQMGAIRCPAVTLDWSPDGRHLLVATTAPRLRVDNNYKLLTYYGQQVAAQPFETLLEAAFVPAPEGAFEDRPQSPERLAASASAAVVDPSQLASSAHPWAAAGGRPSSAQQPIPGATPAAGAAGAAAPSGRSSGYVPPHLRGKEGVPGAGGRAAPQFSLAYDANDRPGKVAPGAASARPTSAKPLPPGAEALAAASRAASKNAKRRANKKKRPDGEEGGDSGSSGDEGGADRVTAATAALRVGDAAAASSSGAAGGGGEDGGGDPTQKKIRALQKKLRQVAQLKERAAKEGDKALEPEQRQKIASEQTLLDELKALGGQL